MFVGVANYVLVRLCAATPTIRYYVQVLERTVRIIALHRKPMRDLQFDKLIVIEHLIYRGPGKHVSIRSSNLPTLRINGRRNYTPPNQSMQRKLDPGLRLATPSLSPASSSADLKR